VLRGMLARLDVRGCIATRRGFVPHWRNPEAGLPMGSRPVCSPIWWTARRAQFAAMAAVCTSIPSA